MRDQRSQGKRDLPKITRASTEAGLLTSH
jgi:hypothetical protein